MIKYIHGSEDSLDIDVLYVAEKMPSFSECQKFCSDIEENRNIVTINNGTISSCFKGTIDEVNNALLNTYKLHEQSSPLLITDNLERDILIKTIRVIRCFISHTSRSIYRTESKKAMKSCGWIDKISFLENLDLKKIDSYGKHGTILDTYKIFAFQLGQIIGLFEHQELYTKSSVANYFPELRPYLYREKTDIDTLIKFLKIFIEKLREVKFEQLEAVVYFIDYKKTVDLYRERYVS